MKSLIEIENSTIRRGAVLLAAIPLIMIASIAGIVYEAADMIKCLKEAWRGE